MKRYRGVMADSARWQRFAFRPDDVVISTPAKCGTTWMQTIVGMLLLGRVDLGAPISTISPWLDMLITTDDEVFGLLERQQHRRFIKTHAPLDGIPLPPSVTAIVLVRHPLDVALSSLDHQRNMHVEHALELRVAASGPLEQSGQSPSPRPQDPVGYLRWFIDNDLQPNGSGPHGLADYCQQIRTYWDAREDPNVHLFHYADLLDDLDGQMRRVAAVLGVSIDEQRWPSYVEAATFSSMRERAEMTAPEAHQGLWQAPEAFFHSGGARDWVSILSAQDRDHFARRMDALAGDAAPWAIKGGMA